MRATTRAPKRRPSIYYIARYEDAAKIAREAKRIGWVDGASSLMNELEVNQFTTARVFVERRDAVTWLADTIKAGKTFFGVGDLTEMITVTLPNRCRYCTCDGAKRERHWCVELDEDGDGQIYDEEFGDDCWAEIAA